MEIILLLMLCRSAAFNIINLYNLIATFKGSGNEYDLVRA